MRFLGTKAAAISSNVAPPAKEGAKSYLPFPRRYLAVPIELFIGFNPNITGKLSKITFCSARGAFSKLAILLSNISLRGAPSYLESFLVLY